MAYQISKLETAFTNDDGQRRFTWNPTLAGHDEDLAVGDVVAVAIGSQGYIVDEFVIESFGEEFGQGARYVYGKIRFVGTVEEFKSQLGGEPLPEDMIPAVKENLGEQGHTEEETEAIISALS